MDDFDYVPGLVPSPFTSTAAPKLTEFDFPEVKPAGEKQERVKKAPKPAAKPRGAMNRMITFVVCVAAALGMCLAVITLNRAIVANNSVISGLQSEINEAKAENVRLNSTLGSLASADKIQEYAVSVLGMQKAERYQIHYFEDRDGDEVVIADGKALDADMQNN